MKRKPKQLEIEFRTWGGVRAGAGRKRTRSVYVSHSKRAELEARHPVHVTVRLRKGLPSLRRKNAYRAVHRAFEAGCDRLGFRLAQFSVLTNHMHLLVEADDRAALTRGMRGLLVRLARALNRLWRRSGSVFAHRFHDRLLRTPREVRNALRYVLLNARRHGIRLRGPDPYSSAHWFDGWRAPLARPRSLAAPIARARTWLLSFGWRRHGPIPITDVPGR